MESISDEPFAAPFAIGSWLAAAATELLALVTAIVGAALGANLALLALDIRGTRVAETEVTPALDPQP